MALTTDYIYVHADDDLQSIVSDATLIGVYTVQFRAGLIGELDYEMSLHAQDTLTLTIVSNLCSSNMILGNIHTSGMYRVTTITKYLYMDVNSNDC